MCVIIQLLEAYLHNVRVVGTVHGVYCVLQMTVHSTIAPVAETGFSHRLTAYKIVGDLFGRSYLRLSIE